MFVFILFKLSINYWRSMQSTDRRTSTFACLRSLVFLVVGIMMKWSTWVHGTWSQLTKRVSTIYFLLGSCAFKGPVTLPSINEKRETRNEKRETRNEKRETRNEKRETRNEKRETRNRTKREMRNEKQHRSIVRSPLTPISTPICHQVSPFLKASVPGGRFVIRHRISLD